MSRIDDRTTVSTEGPAESSGAALVAYHRDGVKVVPLHPDVPVVVGRAWPSDVVVPDLSLSRQHVRVVWNSEGVRVEDLGSTNGTRVRGDHIDVAMVSPGEAVLAGAVTLSVNIAGQAPTEGIDSHERFHQRIGDELLRARTFGRKVGVVMVRAAAAQEEGHVSRWLPRLRQELRPVDHLAPYGPTSALLLLTETDREVSIRTTHRLVASRIGEPLLLAGLALFPEASSREELIEQARRASRESTAEQPVTVARLGDAEAAVGETVVASDAMRRLYELVERVSVASIPVLIIGETGAGKERVAQAIHGSGPRRGGPLRSLNCGAIPATLIESVLFGHVRGAFTGAEAAKPGVFEQASGGSVFLDEVGELSPAAQAALLRVLETKRVTRVGATEETPVDVRVIAATHRDLEAMVDEGTFRQDLLFRLNAMTLRVPPLRERVDEIDLLADRFLDEARREWGTSVSSIAPEARRLLRTYGWPGNVRELRNVIERAVLVCRGELLSAEDLGERLRATQSSIASEMPSQRAVAPEADFKERVRQYEVDLILDALRRAEGNQTQAAKLLRMPLRTLVHKIKAYGIRKLYGPSG